MEQPEGIERCHGAQNELLPVAPAEFHQELSTADD
jgi:hypothetical protein